MSGIERIIEAMTAAPEPAPEVVSLERAAVEKILIELEERDPLRPVVVYLRARLSEPKVELWAMHSVGPGEVFPMLSLEHAREQAEATTKRVKEILQKDGIDSYVTINVVPSPYEPDEHFEILAEEAVGEAERLRKLAIKLDAENEALRKALGGMLFAFDDGVGLDWSAELLDHARTLCPAAEFKP